MPVNSVPTYTNVFRRQFKLTVADPNMGLGASRGHLSDSVIYLLKL